MRDIPDKKQTKVKATKFERGLEGQLNGRTLVFNRRYKVIISLILFSFLHHMVSVIIMPSLSNVALWIKSYIRITCIVIITFTS